MTGAGNPAIPLKLFPALATLSTSFTINVHETAMPVQPSDPLSLTQALDAHTADTLKEFLTLITGKKSAGRKEQSIDLLLSLMWNDAILRELWSRLEPLQQDAVAETVHATIPVFDEVRFHAKYGKLPKWGKLSSYHSQPNLLNLFIHQGVIPLDLKKRLQTFVPVPRKSTLTSRAEVPDLEDDEWVAETEIAALQDLRTLLGMIEAGKVSVSIARHSRNQTEKQAFRLLIRYVGVDRLNNEAKRGTPCKH
ncbi:MAG: hypothetical protein H7834_09795, partial [Magnetococcus sp. YQC-9]